MAQNSWPFENIDTTETEYSQLFRNFGAGVVGVPTGTQLGVSAGAGLAVNVQAGQAMVRGHYYFNTEIESLGLATANPTNPRIDTIVLRLNPTLNSIVLAVVTGTPASSPVAPTLTQTDAAVFEFALANVRVNAAATTPSTITDVRSFIGSRVGIWSTAGRPTPTTGAFGYNTTTASPEVYNGTSWVSLGVPTSINASIIETTLNSQAGTTYSVVSGDAGKLVLTSNGSPVTITIPNVLTDGQRIDFIQNGDGQITFAQSGITLVSTGSKKKLKTKFSAATVIRLSASIYALIGDLTE